MANAATRQTALWVLRRLREAGHQAIFAGGCVRDRLLRLRSADYDIATDATPQQVRRLFPHVLLVGAKFGVAIVVHERQHVEVTTFRSDLSYTDGRRPEGVRFSTPREDASRRDFTINGMFCDPLTGEVIDFVGGRADLAAGVVRTIGPAEQRFAEDYLRMIRAVRFAVRFNFRLDEATAAAIRVHAPKIAGISGERILDELTKMLARASTATALRLLAELGLAQVVLPELFAATEPSGPSGKPQPWTRAVERVEVVADNEDAMLSLGALFAELPAHAIVTIARRWGASNEIRDAAVWMARHRESWRTAGDEKRTTLADFKRLMASPHFEREQAIWLAEEEKETGGRRSCLAIARRAAAVPKRRIAPPPFITGEDLKALGLKQGPLLGKIHHELYDAQLNEQVRTRRAALALAKHMIAEAK